jgi:hypothetical protein
LLLSYYKKSTTYSLDQAAGFLAAKACCLIRQRSSWADWHVLPACGSA